MNQFLTTTFWKVIREEAKKAKSKRAAIAYVTRDLPLAFGRGDTLIVDASDRAIASGATSAALLRKLHKRDVKLFSYPGLHAKTIVLDQTAFVSPANLSDSSIKLLVEAAVRTDNPSVVSKAISFIQDLTKKGEVIESAFLDRISRIPVNRLPPATGRSHRRLDRQKGESKTWLIGVHTIDDPKDPAERKRVAKGEAIATDLLNSSDSEVWWMRWSKRSRFGQQVRKGDNIIAIWRDSSKGDAQIVYRHTPVLLNQAEPTCHRIFYESPATARRMALPWKNFKQLVKQVGIGFEVQKNMSRALRPEHSDALHDLWNAARRR